MMYSQKDGKAKNLRFKALKSRGMRGIYGTPSILKDAAQ